MIRYREVELKFSDIWRVFISGSSSAGKTYFAKQLLASGLFEVKRIYYFHPDIHESFPIDWCDDFKTDIICQPGLPTLEDIEQMPKNSCIVLDDLYTQVAKSELMSYLFRVLSSKKQLHVIVMTQRYYAEGPQGLNIRNCSNYHVLMSNVDARTNMRVAFSMGLEKDIRVAIEQNKKQLYPYIVIDRTNYARVNGLQVYVDIFDRYKNVIMNGMSQKLVPFKEFDQNWEFIGDGHAKRKPVKESKSIEEIKSTKETKPTEETESTEETKTLKKEGRRRKSKVRRSLERKIKRRERRCRIKGDVSNILIHS